MTTQRRRSAACAWCGNPIAEVGVGRRRRYCKQSCRQRAYEQRSQLEGTSIPADAVILTRSEADDLVDRLFAVRCAAEDVVTAVGEHATTDELSDLCDSLLVLAASAERLR